MKHFLILCLFPVWAMAFSPVQNDRGYQAFVDLTNIVDDRVNVNIVVPVLERDTVIYNMPKIVPGTYKIYDFGRYVHNFTALTSSGDTLDVVKLNENQWQISNAKELYKIDYWSSASYNEAKSRIFAPAGSDISEEVFLMNNFSFFGYLQDYKHVPFTLEVKKPTAFYGVTSLPETSRTDSVDVFAANDYFQLHDCPILYSVPDTASVMVAGIPIVIGVYSEKENLHAAQIRDALTAVFEAAADYLGGTLPADKYTVIIYGLEGRAAMRGTGALEHHTSTVLTAPDATAEVMKMFSANGDPMQLFRDIVAHEFFHIVTPLNIHSKQINDYDFINPQMSEHLWLYEGITEYNSMLSQARGGVTSLRGFLDETQSKLTNSRRYNQYVPFTEMSKYALSFYEKEYGNVYQKGALIGMATDIKLRSLSEGKFGLIDLLEKMWTIYGADTFFVDQDLFGLLAENSYPEMEEFFVRHIASAEPLPLVDLFEKVGITYIEDRKVERISIGNMHTIPSPKNNGLYVYKFDSDDKMVKELGIQEKDFILEMNGKKVDFSENNPHGTGLFDEFLASLKPGQKVTLVVARLNKEGISEEIKLKARATTSVTVEKDILSVNDNLTDNQRTLRKSWINY